MVAGQPAIEPDDLAVPDAVVVRLVRRTHSDLTWLEVRSEEGRGVRLVTTLESARRLLAVLQRLVVEAAD
jgi:KaiC/GvpD/RAD55 family RecA-like ATPase